MSYANRKQMSSNRTVSIIVVALLHVVLGYALVSGLAYNVMKKATTDLKTFDVTEPPPPPEEKPPPPEKQPNTPPPPQVVAPPPMVRMQTIAPPIQTVSVAPPPVITPTARPAPPAPPAPPPAPVKREAAKARGSLVGLFSNDDYPSSALSANEHGTTAVRLTIGTDGRVSACDVTSSSGSSALDSATCNILRRRARFTPAMDTNGQPTTDTYSQRITWQIPAE
ncbi:MAG: energy transducer TonB [Pseudomonadota bacterium]|jgi:protein TonB|nr:energy transducer TonB [Pseudomonadota bacterium]